MTGGGHGSGQRCDVGPALSVVIPAFNEAAGLEATLERVCRYLAGRGEPCEVIVVDDGSDDATFAVACRVADRVAAGGGPAVVRVLRHARRRGKGAAVRTGMLAAAGRRRLMCDADLSADIGQLERLEAALDAGCDVAIGSRDLPACVLAVPQPRWRRWLAAAFRAYRRRLILPDLRDTQCGFKLFEGGLARRVFARQRLCGWLFDCEVLLRARRLGGRICEVPVVWRDRGPSRVRALRAAVGAVAAVLWLRWRLGRGDVCGKKC